MFTISFRRHSGHGWTCRWVAPAANDPERTLVRQPNTSRLLNLEEWLLLEARRYVHADEGTLIPILGSIALSFVNVEALAAGR
jgi:hypothetical protein